MSDKDCWIDQGGSLSIGACDPRFVMMWEWTSIMPVIFRAEGVDRLSFFCAFDMAVNLLGFGEYLMWSRFADARSRSGVLRNITLSCRRYRTSGRAKYYLRPPDAGGCHSLQTKNARGDDTRHGTPVHSPI